MIRFLLDRFTKHHFRAARRIGKPIGWSEARKRARTLLEKIGRIPVREDKKAAQP